VLVLMLLLLLLHELLVRHEVLLCLVPPDEFRSGPLLR